MPSVDLQIASDAPALPQEADFVRWVTAALPAAKQGAEVTIRLVDASESQTLNSRYRHKDAPTNVLSFPADLPPHLDLPLLGDLVVCAPVVQREAEEQGKPIEAHWAHMVVHGVLHLLGYDHQEEQQAAAMEAMETEILAGMDYPDPYQSNL